MVALAPVSTNVMLQSSMSRLTKSTFLPPLRPDEIVGDRLVVVQEIVFNYVALVAKTEDEVLVPEMGIVFHQVPEDRPRPDLHHGFGDIIDISSEPHAGSAAKEHDFHPLSPQTGIRKPPDAMESTARQKRSLDAIPL